jgi:sulfoxide reductase heme-binding subunit YedZ
MLIATHAAALAPLVVTIVQYATGALSVDPIRAVTLRTGRYTLVLLVLTLACTPAAIMTGFGAVVRLRKPMGLYAALYATLHFLVFAAWDYGLQLDLIWLEVRQKPYIQVGLVTLAILILLAITSTRGWMRRLGRRWKRLHRWVYAAGLLAVLHYLWVVKASPSTPLTYGAIVVALLAVRIPPVARAIRALRSRLGNTRARSETQ